jgi:hypothetical protein
MWEGGCRVGGWWVCGCAGVPAAGVVGSGGVGEGSFSCPSSGPCRDVPGAAAATTVAARPPPPQQDVLVPPRSGGSNRGGGGDAGEEEEEGEAAGAGGGASSPPSSSSPPLLSSNSTRAVLVECVLEVRKPRAMVDEEDRLTMTIAERTDEGAAAGSDGVTFDVPPAALVLTKTSGTTKDQTVATTDPANAR